MRPACTTSTPLPSSLSEKGIASRNLTCQPHHVLLRQLEDGFASKSLSMPPVSMQMTVWVRGLMLGKAQVGERVSQLQDVCWQCLAQQEAKTTPDKQTVSKYNLTLSRPGTHKPPNDWLHNDRSN